MRAEPVMKDEGETLATKAERVAKVKTHHARLDNIVTPIRTREERSASEINNVVEPLVDGFRLLRRGGRFRHAAYVRVAQIVEHGFFVVAHPAREVGIV
jgi:hypothetical protein